MPQFDPLENRELDLDELFQKVQEAYKRKDYRRLDHYASLLACEAAEKLTPPPAR